MKKYLYIAIAAATFASCSQDEVMDFNQEAISFGNAVVDNVPRAANAEDPSFGATNKLTAFKVWGAVQGTNNNTTVWVPVFANDNVTGTVGVADKTTGENVWNCTSKTQYWIAGATYNFAAVVNGNVTEGDNALPATIAFETDGTKDLLYARSQEYVGSASDNPLVKFEFAHLLSKVKFTLENTTVAGTTENPIGEYTYTLTDIKVSNAITQGTYTVNDTRKTENDVTTYTIGGSWASTEDPAKGQDFDNIVGVTNLTSAECANEKLLIPLTTAKVSCNVNLYYGGALISTIEKTDVNVGALQAGYAYNIKVSVGLNEPIKFTVEKDPTWENGNTQDSNADNVKDYIPAA